MKVFCYPYSVETCLDERLMVSIDLPTRPMRGDMIFGICNLFNEKLEELKEKDIEKYEFVLAQYDLEDALHPIFDEYMFVRNIIFSPNKENGEYEMYLEIDASLEDAD